MKSNAEIPWRAVPLLVAVLCLLYVPTVSGPFDFEDDGNIVYSSAPDSGFVDRLVQVWNRTLTELNTLGPFRPVFWAYFELQNYLFGVDVLSWRVARLGILGISAFLLLALLLDLGLPMHAASLAVGFSFLAPLRSEIWYHIGYSEGIAMPMVLLALVAARKASRTEQPLLWDILGFLSILGAILVKNVFLGALPSQVLLRVWPDTFTVREGIRTHWKPAAALSLVAVLPIGHLIYFKHLVEGHSLYQVGIPTIKATHGMVRAVFWRASGLEFIGPGLIIALVGVFACPPARRWALDCRLRRAWVLGLLLTLNGVMTYLPVGAVSGRYTVPAAWGVDVGIAALLTCVPAVTWAYFRRAIYIMFMLGGAALLVVNLYHQQVFISRCKVLWQTTQWLIRESPPSPLVMVINPAVSKAEVVHMHGHLVGQSWRRDIRIADLANTFPGAISAADLLLTVPGVMEIDGFAPVTSFPMRMSLWSWVPDRFRKKGNHGIVIWHRVQRQLSVDRLSTVACCQRSDRNQENSISPKRKGLNFAGI